MSLTETFLEGEDTWSHQEFVDLSKVVSLRVMTTKGAKYQGKYEAQVGFTIAGNGWSEQHTAYFLTARRAFEFRDKIIGATA